MSNEIENDKIESNHKRLCYDDIFAVPIIKKSRYSISTILQPYIEIKNKGPTFNVTDDIMNWITNIDMSLSTFGTNDNKCTICIDDDNIVFDYVKLIKNIHLNNIDVIELFLQNLMNQKFTTG